MRTVVIGVGNPTLTDDGVGIRAARRIADRLDRTPAAERPDARVTVLCAGGLRLMEAMVGYRRAIVLDALVTGAASPGTTVELVSDDLSDAHNLACVHDLSLPYALELGRAAGADLPDEIRIFGVRAADVTTFSEVLTPAVEAGVPALVARVWSLLSGGSPESGRS